MSNSEALDASVDGRDMSFKVNKRFILAALYYCLCGLFFVGKASPLLFKFGT